VYTWEGKKSKVMNDEYSFDYTITKKIFNETGLLLEVQTYETWGIYDRQPYLEFSKSQWIIKWKKWKNGKEIIIARNIATEEYFRKLSKRSKR